MRCCVVRNAAARTRAFVGIRYSLKLNALCNRLQFNSRLEAALKCYLKMQSIPAYWLV